jgi:hypothetical protein
MLGGLPLKLVLVLLKLLELLLEVGDGVLVLLNPLDFLVYVILEFLHLGDLLLEVLYFCLKGALGHCRLPPEHFLLDP